MGCLVFIIGFIGSVVSILVLGLGFMDDLCFRGLEVIFGRFGFRYWSLIIGWRRWCCLVMVFGSVFFWVGWSCWRKFWFWGYVLMWGLFISIGSSLSFSWFCGMCLEWIRRCRSCWSGVYCSWIIGVFGVFGRVWLCWIFFCWFFCFSFKKFGSREFFFLC